MLESQLLSLFLHRFNTLLKCSRMELKKEIRILGRRFEVEPRAKESLKGITVGEKLSYRFYDDTYQGMSLLFVEPKKGNPSPRTCAITGKRLTEALGLPAVFILAPGPTYERRRLADKGVFFVMSEEYAHLPGIIALEKTSNRKIAEVLTLWRNTYYSITYRWAVLKECRQGILHRCFHILTKASRWVSPVLKM
jgi:hypothetical protein